MESNQKYHIEPNTVQETLVIPLFARKVCGDSFPELFKDEEAEHIINSLDYDFEKKGRKFMSFFGKFGALEVAQRQYDLEWEIREYVKKHPKAAVVNLGCGLDATFRVIAKEFPECVGYNVDMPDVIAVREQLLPCIDRETNIASDLTDHSWMDKIPSDNGAVFIASGVFYYITEDNVKKLCCAMAEHFPGGVLAFDACNKKGLKLMMKAVVEKAGMTDIGAFFSVDDDGTSLRSWSEYFVNVTAKSYMSGYRDIRPQIVWFYRLLCNLADSVFNMNVIHIEFKK